MRAIVVKERHTFDTRTEHMQLIFQFSKVFNFLENHGSSLLFVNFTRHIYHIAADKRTYQRRIQNLVNNLRRTFL